MRRLAPMTAILALVACDALGNVGREIEPEQFGKRIEADFSLTGDGIVFIQPDGSVRYLRFGAVRAEVERMAAARWGEPQRTMSDGCTVGPMEFSEYRDQRHMLNYQDGKLVGWVAQPETTGALAITRQMVQAENGFAMTGGIPLGPRFTFQRDGGTLSGVLTDDGANGKVQMLWAGTLCQFG